MVMNKANTPHPVLFIPLQPSYLVHLAGLLHFQGNFKDSSSFALLLA